MEIPVVKRRGNPTLNKKAEASIEDELSKQYIFQLLKTHENQKPRDSKTNELVGSPYQPWFGVVNSGLAWDSEYISPSEAKKPKDQQKAGGQRRWRYLHNFPTVWVDEQIDPEPSREDLASNQNDLIFRQGVLRVFGHEKMKLQAMMLNNAFKGCARPLKNIPFEYELLDQGKIDKEVLQILDDQFEAEKAAREATIDEMYATSLYFGIDLNKSDDSIRKEFIHKARTNPKVFNREFVNPKNRYKYVFSWAFATNILSTTIVPGCVYIADSNVKAYDLRTDDAIEELSSATFASEVKAKNLFDKMEAMYKAEN